MEEKNKDEILEKDEIKVEEEEVCEDIVVEESVEDKLNDEIKRLNEEISKLKNDYALAYADTENIRKRLNNEAEMIKKYRIQSFALEILPALDNLERALSQEPNEENQLYYQGVKMIYDQLINALKNEGVSEVEANEKDFDPNFMQSILSEKVEGVKEGVVIEVLQKGYKLKDRILRPALVKIAE